jgi:hypothetical protein
VLSCAAASTRFDVGRVDVLEQARVMSVATFEGKTSGKVRIMGYAEQELIISK